MTPDEKAISQPDTTASVLTEGEAADVYARLPIAPVHAYYRSRLLTAKIATNPLVAAASALLSIAPRLRRTTAYIDVHALYQHLVHEIRAFETNAQNQGYRSETIVVARYILCTFLDESILASHWGSQGAWEPYKLLLTFHKESWGGDRFFLILSRSSEDPVVHIELLELIYLCISLGYEGKYHAIEAGQAQLGKVRDDLYQRIRWQRGEIKKQLLIHSQSSMALPKPAPMDTFPLWLIVVLTGTLLLTLYSGFNYLLTRHTVTLHRELHRELPVSVLSPEPLIKRETDNKMGNKNGSA
jgi:type VI secretion system protein ImpK